MHPARLTVALQLWATVRRDESGKSAAGMRPGRRKDGIAASGDAGFLKR